ncbi:alpha/beta hydrolase domain-containing protein [Phenylobacterium sp.]|uniref:alpha/beta hydrolase domain-containing protein n=1 Tax=Phenylobacterium sp. TaxID=1871053 RepID=UPI002BFC00C1|nr:alpha/beta hydrolase domain-containing protein [Phenylobacterium sp.]HLZ74856.1 alpha/beta hydrolase domain-containing protein [Phenylobacterium sp.]
MGGRRIRVSAAAAVLALGLLAPAAQARVVRVDIASRAPIAGTFGQAGAYELISGRFYGEVDPKDPKNAIITDLKLAPRNARGLVEYSATFQIAKPLDMAKASGVLIYNVPNRGNGRAGGDADGHVRVVSGWQADMPANPNLQLMTVPVARNPDGSSITGPVIVRFFDMPKGSVSLPLLAGIGRLEPQPAPANLDAAKARLTRRRSDTEAPIAIPAGDYAFADCRTTPFPGQPDPTQLCLKGGFDPAFAYELTYTAKDPLVQGLGFAATRDLNAFLRYGGDSPAAPNPVAGRIKWAIGVGASQSGNYLRTFLNLGFNQGEDGRIVFDGINPHIAGRAVPLNVRFAVPGGAAQLYEPGSDGTLWWSRYDDKARALGPVSLLTRCTPTHTCPKVMETFGSAEFWGLRMSPNLVGTDAKADVPLPANVRRYYFPAVTHGGGAGGFAVLPRSAPGAGACALPANPNPVSEEYRALTKAFVAWVTTGAEPPPSLYPTLAHGDLVEPTRQALGFPVIPGAPSPDGKIMPLYRYDFGPGFNRADISGVLSRNPPRVVATLPSRVPRVDADGIEIAGLRSVQARVPLGTYLGWSVQASGYFAGQQCGFAGGYIPFAATRAEREAAHDPRPSLEERYGTHAGFVARVKAAADDLVAHRYLLSEDAERIVRDAQASKVLEGR